MLRKAVFFSLAIVFVLAGSVSMAPAAQNVANTSQKGSLLIFPKILVQSAFFDGAGLKAPGGSLGQPPGYVNTFITIGNDYYQEVWVKCYWVDENQSIEDFMFRLTPNQPIYFNAALGYGEPEITVPPFVGKGELKCWAVNAAGDQQISWNHLYGNAFLVSEEMVVPYNAWSFTARGVAQGAAVGKGGEILLTGAPGGYDACPTYLVTNFFSAEDRMDVDNPDLTLVPCKQDLRQDRTPTCTKAQFNIWNANETKYTGAYQCLKCWYEGFLDEIGTNPTGFGGEKFTWRALHTDVARFTVKGVPSTVCKFGKASAIDPEAKCPAGNGVASPFLGVLLYAEHYVDDIIGILPEWGITPFGAGADGTGFVLWDPAGGAPEAPAR
jgi:hypothetical protein